MDGRLVDALEASGLRDRVNIFITADHGFANEQSPRLCADTGRGEIFYG